jgi:iron complex outermembrane receptor protein
VVHARRPVAAGRQMRRSPAPRRFPLGAAGLAFSLLYSAARGIEAQNAGNGPPPLSTQAASLASVLKQSVSIAVSDVPLDLALRILADAAGLRLSYSSDVVPVTRRVTINAVGQPVAEVLDSLLRGTGIEAVATPSGYIVLVRAPGSLSGSGQGPGRVDPVPLASGAAAGRAQLMDRVIVMGTPWEGAPERELPNAVTVIGRRQIEALGAASMEEVLRSGIPGLVVWDLGILSPLAQIGSVRGSASFTANYLKTYVDGVELANPSMLFAIDPYSVDRIEIIRGPQGSALYGSDAISGVVHVITRRGSIATTWKPQLDLLASGGIAQSRYRETPAALQRYSGMLAAGAGSTSLGLGAGLSSSAGTTVPGGHSYQWGIYGGFRHIGGPLRVEGSFRYADIDFKAPPNPLLVSPDLDQVRPLLEQQRIQHETYALTVDFHHHTYWQQALVLGLDRNAGAIPPQREPASAADALLGADGERNSKATLRYSSTFTALGRSGRSVVLSAGADFTRLDRERRASQDPLANSSQSVALYRDAVANSGLYAQVKFAPTLGVVLTGGIRADHNSSFGEQFRRAWSPMVGAVYTRDNAWGTLKLRAAYGKGIRPPPPSARLAIATLSYRQEANPWLEPEAQRGSEAGVEFYAQERLSLSITAFSQVASGLIQQVIVEKSGSRAIQYQNVGTIGNRGVEMDGSVRIGKLTASASIGWVESRVRDLAPNYSGELVIGDRVPEVPLSSGSFALAGRLGSVDWVAGTTYVGKWRGYDWARFLAMESQGTTPGLRPFLVDYRPLVRPYLGFIGAAGRAWSWFLRAENLLNVQHNERDNLQLVPGRRLTLGVRLKR